jgi:hypothetical protein
VADELKANPDPGPGIAHDFDCTHNPCRCRPVPDLDALIARLREWASALHPRAYERRALTAAADELERLAEENQRLRDSLRFPPTWTQSRAAAALERYEKALREISRSDHAGETMRQIAKRALAGPDGEGTDA